MSVVVIVESIILRRFRSVGFVVEMMVSSKVEDGRVNRSGRRDESRESGLAKRGGRRRKRGIFVSILQQFTDACSSR